MKNKVKEMEDEAEKLRKIMGESEEQLGSPTPTYPQPLAARAHAWHPPPPTHSR